MRLHPEAGEQMTDIHCHLLPGVDDGPQDWATTIEMCKLAKADGLTHIVATPHADHKYLYSRQRLSDSLDELAEKVPDMDFSLGCDFHLSHENIQDAVDHPERYVIGDTAYLLVELSDFQTPHQMTEGLFRLHSAGFLTIVTHPERNSIIDQYPDLPAQFFDMGSYLQITAGALCGDWGRKAKKTCEALLKKGLVSFIASDAHEAKRRKPILSIARNAAAKIVGDEGARFLVQENPCAVVSNQPLMEEVSTGF
jgi:protein-tyrosine phosphatase